MADQIQKQNSSQGKQDLNQQIKDLEDKYSQEILNKDDLALKLEQFEKKRVELENDVEKDEEQIKVKIAELREIKDWIEARLKIVNEKKLILKEIEEDEQQIKQLEDSKKKINEGIKSLDQKLANLKQ